MLYDSITHNFKELDLRHVKPQPVLDAKLFFVQGTHYYYYYYCYYYYYININII